jgi:fumarylpyruvate hydrolase
MPRQEADVSTMIFGVAEIIAELSRLFELAAGDLIYTGTPAGVGPLVPGDRFEATFSSQLSLRGALSHR